MAKENGVGNRASREKPHYEMEEKQSTTSQYGSVLFTLTVFVVVAAAVLFLTWSDVSIVTIALALLLGWLMASAVNIAFQWEKAVIARFGKINRIVGPGIYFLIPIIESKAATIDQRVRTTAFGAEETLSSDLVPVDVDAVLFWVVWDAEKACTEVRNYEQAISLCAQTAMRDAIGQISLSEIAVRRSYLDKELQRIISEKVEEWGLSVVSVEIRDIVIPKELQDAMSKQAQAERERDARVLLAEVERDISEMYVEAASVYGCPEKALQLRTMNLVHDSVKQHGGMIVVPSAYSEGFNDGGIDAMKDLLR
ncbi:slipin family protein [Adlercreutzia sp. R7]|uniref:Slipin family protein n=1 Tax=Adlercreutzia wanghongyangiae TaxID=3111451 RepID=A0ABU6IF87_9ACTN|nr:slipin family protein [Adlercreutzia sp. R7]